jgi:hypothetical protein
VLHAPEDNDALALGFRSCSTPRKTMTPWRSASAAISSQSDPVVVAQQTTFAFRTALHR